MPGWDIVKDVSEIAGAIGTAAIFSIRTIVKAKVKEQLFNQKFTDMQQEIEELKKTKADAGTSNLEVKYIRQVLVELRSDINMANSKMSMNLESISKSLGNLEGTINTVLDFTKRDSQKHSA